MMRPTTHFDQVPLKDIMEVVQKEAQREAAESANRDITANRNVYIITESGLTTDGEQP